MSIKKVQFITYALVALLSAGWMQPALAHACTSMLQCDDSMNSAGFPAKAGKNCSSIPLVPHFDAGHDGSEHDTARHGLPAQKAGEKPCTMKACSLSAQIPMLTQHTEFFAIASGADRVAIYSNTLLPSPHLSSLFRPPRTSPPPRG